MAGSVNKVILIGAVGKDPEVRTTQDGTKIANLSLATSETWNDLASGERKERTEWHRVVVYNDRIADAAERFVRKGAKIYVEGSIQSRKWTDQAGQEKYSTEIVIGRFNGTLTMLDRPSGGSGSSGSQQRSGGGGTRQGAPQPDLDDAIPF